MNYSLSILSISLLLSAGISLVLAISIIKQHAGSARISLSFLMLAVAEWSFTSFMVGMAHSEAYKIFWSTLRNLGMTTSPVFFFTFSLEFFTQQNWLKRRQSIIFWVIPFLTILVAMTNSWTGWLWDHFTVISETKILVFSPGPYAWVATGYSYVLTAASIFFLVRAVIVFREGFRFQAIITLVAALFPVLANLSYQFGKTLVTGLDLTPYAFVLTGIVLAWSIQYFQYLNPLPVARDELVEIMSDAVIVLNSQSQVTYLNNAACANFNISLDQAVGQPLQQVLQNWPDLSDRITHLAAGPREAFEIQSKDDHWYDVRTLLLKNRRGRINGSLIVLHDITQQKLSELLQVRLAKGLQAVAEVSTAIATTLDTQKLLQMVVDLTCERFDLYHAQIYILDASGNHLVLATGSGQVGAMLVSQEEMTVLQSGSTLVARAARTRQGMIVNDVTSDLGFERQPLFPDTLAEMAVPITASDQLLGVLDVKDNHVGRFTQQDLDIMNTLAAQIAVALHNAGTFSQLQILLDGQRKELSLLYAMDSKTTETPAIKELLGWTAEQIPLAMKYPDACTVSILYKGQLLGNTTDSKTINQISQDILLAGDVVGRVFASYEQPINFSTDEQSLLSNVAQRLQNYIVELTLRESQTQLREALHIAKMGHFELDLVSGVLTLSDEFYELMGTDVMAQHGYHLPLDAMQRYFLREDRHQAKLDFREILNSPDLVFFEREYRFLRHEDKNPALRHAIIRAQVHRDDQGKAITLTGTIQDITERVKVNAEMLRLATVIEQAQEAIVITDMNGNILYANPFFEDVTGYPVSEVLGTNPRFLKSGQHDTSFYEILWNTILRGETWSGTFINKKKDGSIYYESATIFPIKDGAGNIINYATVKRDISAQVSAEQEVRAFARQQALLLDITNAALEQTDFSSMLSILTKRLGEMYAADGSYITLWDEQHGVPIPVAAFGNMSDVYTSLAAGPEEKTLTGSVLETGRSLAVDDVFNTPYISPSIADLFPTRSALGLPLIASGKKLGAVMITFTHSHHFTQSEIIQGEQAASQIALALLKGQLLETAQRKAKESETLMQAASAVTRSLKLEETIDIILEQLNLVVPYDSASVLFLQGNQLEIVGGHGFIKPNEVIGLKFSLDGDNPCALVYSTRQPCILEDAPLVYKSFAEAPHNRIRGWLGVPLIVQGRVTGMIALDSLKTGTFNPDHARLAAAYADQVAIALENARLFAQTQELAITDPLTGLYNRRFFFSQARTEFERARRYQGQVSIVMLDIDDFKKINDTYGHLIGDQVLQALAKICHENVREIDVVGRYGGEEFVILLPETPLVFSQAISTESINPEEEPSPNSGAITAAERLRRKVAQSSIQTEKGILRITISLGVAQYQPDISSPEMLLDHADIALYRAKQAGKNRVEIYDNN